MTRIIRRKYKEFELPPEGVHRGKLTEIKDLEPAVKANDEKKERVNRLLCEYELLYGADADECAVAEERFKA